MDVDPTFGFVISAFIAVAAIFLLIQYMPQWNERLAFLAAVCGVAIAVVFVLLAMN